MSGQIGLLERQSLPDRRLYLPASHVLLASLYSERLVRLAPVESAIMAIYFLAVIGIGIYLMRST
jgi:hypothetical protein